MVNEQNVALSTRQKHGGNNKKPGQAYSCESAARSPLHSHHTERNNWMHT